MAVSGNKTVKVVVRSGRGVGELERAPRLEPHPVISAGLEPGVVVHSTLTCRIRKEIFSLLSSLTNPPLYDEIRKQVS
jgi:hypothetical protein